MGEPGESLADLDQVHPRAEGKVRGRDAVLLRDSEVVATHLDVPWDEDDPEHWERAAAAAGRVILAGRLGPDNVRAAIDRVRPWAVDASSRLETAPVSRITRRCELRRGGPPVTTTYGPYGGRYVPETLIPALDELTAAWETAKKDDSFWAEVGELGRT